MSGQQIDRKLRLTAAVLGTVTRKDLAAAFRRINPKTPFDVERANKWLQGRARPRERQVYDDWAKLLDLGRSGQWIAECDVDAFLDAICTRHVCDRDALEREGHGATRDRQVRENGVQPNPVAHLAGTFLTYSDAWSRYFPGRLICGELSVKTEAKSPQLAASYIQNLPSGSVHLRGSLAANGRTLAVELHDPDTDEHYTMRLFRPAPPASVLAGFFSGPTYLSPETELTTARIVLVRLPSTCGRRSTAAYLPAGASVAADLASVGLPMRNPAEVDRRLSAFLGVDHDRSIDRIDGEQYGALTELFDSNWLNEVASAKA